MLARILSAIVMVSVLAGCSASSTGSSAASDTTITTATSTTAVAAEGGAEQGATTPSSTTPSSTTAAPATTAATTPTTAPAPDEPPCQTLYDAAVDGAAPWFVVNDGVMGGQSAGSLTEGIDAITFSGELVTDGGGFSLIRAALLPGSLAGADIVRLEAVPDDRTYLLTISDRAPNRDPRTNFQAPMRFEQDGDGGAVADVALDSMQAVVFGRPVDEAPLDADLAAEIAIQLSDGLDGEFEFDLVRLSVCSAE
ncbi:MAG: CIA30 family protein [Actinomycetota bacterium]